MTTSASCTLASFVSRSLLAATIAGASLLTACGGGSDAPASSVSQAPVDSTAAGNAPGSGGTGLVTNGPGANTGTNAGTATGTSTTTASVDTSGDAAQLDAMRTVASAIGTAGTAVLSWKASTNVVSYRVYYGTSSRAYVQPLGAGLPAATPAITVSGLTSGQTYWFSVTGIDANGKETAYSDEMTKTVL